MVTAIDIIGLILAITLIIGIAALTLGSGTAVQKKGWFGNGLLSWVLSAALIAGIIVFTTRNCDDDPDMYGTPHMIEAVEGDPV